MTRPPRTFFANRLLSTVVAVLLVCAFGIGWTHVHGADRDASHSCLLCQWTAAPAFLSVGSGVILALHVLGSLSPVSDPASVHLLHRLLRTRSPPPISNF